MALTTFKKLPRKKRRLLIILSILMIAFLFCIHIELNHLGIVKDADTHEPIGNAVVHFDMQAVWVAPFPPLPYREDYIDFKETYTDSEGKFNLPFDIYLMSPFSFVRDKSLSIYKPGYFPAKVIEAPFKNVIDLYKITYYLDFLHTQKRAKKGNFDIYMPSNDDNLKKCKKYIAAVKEMADLDPKQYVNKGAFLKFPGTRLTRLFRRSLEYKYKKRDYSKSYTYGIDEDQDIYYAFDESSMKWLAFDSRGKIQKFDDKYLQKYMFFSSEMRWGTDPIYANPDLIYYPATVLSPEKTETPEKGNICALVGGSRHFLAIEDNGKAIFYHSIFEHTEDGYLTTKDIPVSDKDTPIKSTRFLLLADAGDLKTFVLCKISNYYHLYKISFEDNPITKKQELMITKIPFTLPINEEVKSFVTDGRNFYFVFKQKGIRKYSLDKYRKGPLREITSFFENSRFVYNQGIYSLIIGRSVRTTALYFTTSEDTIYRLSEDGIPDYCIKIQ